MTTLFYKSSADSYHPMCSCAFDVRGSESKISCIADDVKKPVSQVKGNYSSPFIE